MYKIKNWGCILKRLINYSKYWKKSLIIAIIILCIAVITEISGPILVTYFIDHGIAKHKISYQLVLIFTITFIFLQIISGLLHYLQAILFNRISINIIQKLRLDLMQIALFQPVINFDTNHTSQIISRIISDTEMVRDLYVIVIATILRSTTLIIAMIIAMSILDWKMALVVMFILPIILLVMMIYQYYSTPIARRIRHYLAEINNIFHEVIIGMNVIQQFNQQDNFSYRINKISKLHYIARMDILRLDGLLLRPMFSLFSAVILCGLLTLFSFYTHSIVKVGIIYAFIAYLGRLNEPLIALTTQQAILQQAIIAGERIFELIDLKPQKYGHDNLPLKSGSITIQRLNFSYCRDKKILININLKIASYSFIGIVGCTGSGKSTLANLIMGYYPITSGNIYIDNRSINKLSHSVLRKGIAIVQQDPIILADTIFVNISLGRNISEKIIWNVLEQVELINVVRSMSHGIYTKLNERGNNLSVGQKQLLSLARVLVTSPKIIILDEATANIDFGTEKAIQKVIRSIRKYTTLIVIAHRLSTIIEADNILVLHSGQIVENGNHKQLLKKQNYYWRMCNNM
ncbi:MAG: SmdB family multidrug efflux ABC transporter permease/ATP-binding protein [Pantoea sp. Brub]|nr:SmdB family multidrug efflux ABC transporter permease/ATP-binding protein [Pantoea sp. Brub]